MRTALVLGAGGLVGQAYHLGVLSALDAGAGFDARVADVLVGTSAGALVAAGLGAGLSAADLAAELLGRPRTVDGERTRARAGGPPVAMPAPPPAARRRGTAGSRGLLTAARHPLATRPGAVAAALLPAVRQSTELLARGVRRLHPRGWPDRDLRICAVRTRDVRRVVFDGRADDTPDLGVAVAASCATPGWFTPVVSGGESYVDGGAHSAGNADVVLPDRPDLVVVVSPRTGVPAGLRAELGGRPAGRGSLGGEVLRLRRAGSRVVVLQPGPGDLQAMGGSPMRTERLDEVFERAVQSTRRRLDLQPGLLE